MNIFNKHFLTKDKYDSLMFQQKDRQISEHSGTNSPNIGKYIATSSRDNVDNGSFYCNNMSLMADMEAWSTNGISVTSDLVKGLSWSMIVTFTNQDSGIFTHLYDKGWPTDKRTVFTRCLFAENWLADKTSIKRHFPCRLPPLLEARSCSENPSKFLPWSTFPQKSKTSRWRVNLKVCRASHTDIFRLHPSSVTEE